MSSVTPLEHTVIGGIAGFTEVCVMQPTIAIKNALQQGRPIPMSPSVLYRGLAINSAATFPITAVQFGVNRALEKLHQTQTGFNPGSLATMGIAMTAGATSGFIGCPAELLMIQQQKTGLSLAGQFKELVRTFGMSKIYKGLVSAVGWLVGGRGLLLARWGSGQEFCLYPLIPHALVLVSKPQHCRFKDSLASVITLLTRTHHRPLLSLSQPSTMMRESLYTAGYLGVAPLLKTTLREHEAFEGMPGAAALAAGVSAGILATVTSHPADTIKTRMQAFPDNKAHPEYASFVSTTRHILATEGVQGFFAGVLPRTFRLIGAVFILGGIRTALVDAVEDYRYDHGLLPEKLE